MKKFFILAFAALSMAAVDYIFFAEAQSGNGTNGMTRAAPTAATEGVAVKSSAFSISEKPLAQYARVSIRASSTNVFQNAGNLSWLRAYHYAPDSRDSTGATYGWRRAGYLDVQVDGGSSGTIFANSMEFPPIGPLPILTPSDRFIWACDNCQQSGTLDAGVTLAIELVTGPK